MVIIYFFLCLILILAGALTKNFNIVQLCILPIGLLAILFQKLVHKDKIKDLGFRKCRFKDISQSFLLPVLIIFSIFFIDFVFNLIRLNSLSVIKNPWTGKVGIHLGDLFWIIPVAAINTFIAALITEELAFRGYLITRLSKLGPMRALFISSFLFGIWHIPPSLILWNSSALGTIVYVFNISLLGLLFGYVFLESKSLYPPSLFHGVWNALEYGLFGLGNEPAVFLGNHKILFDPEEGLVGTVVLLAFALVILKKKAKKLVDLPTSVREL